MQWIPLSKGLAMFCLRGVRESDLLLGRGFTRDLTGAKQD